jgi:hypothetical protein
MKKGYYLLIAISILLCNSCKTKFHETNSQKWTWLFYNDADFEQIYNPLYHFESTACSNENLDILILEDTFDGGGVIYYLDSEHHLNILEELEEVNMGSRETLFTGLAFAKEHYPADRYILSVYDHGGGWEGSCWDETSNNDNLTMDEMNAALQNSGGIDVLMFTGPCLMGNVEAAYEVRNNCDYYLASEDASGFTLWSYMIDDICLMIYNNPELSNREFVNEVVSLARYYWHDDPNMDFTLSAVETSKLPELINAIDDVSKAYLDPEAHFVDKWITVRDSIQYFGVPGFIVFKDLFDFAEKLLQVEQNEAISKKLISMKTTLKKCISAEFHDEYYEAANGLTILFKGFQSYDITDYYDPDYGLDFAEDTHMDELQLQMFGKDDSNGLKAIDFLKSYK